MGLSDLEGVMRNILDSGKYGDMTRICEERILRYTFAVMLL